MPAVKDFTKDEFLQRVGNTPLIRFDSISEETGRNIYFKAEYTNPGGSIKDRAVIHLIRDVIDSGLAPGGTLVESTAGNTGVAIALLARSYNPPFKVKLFVPDSLVQEKITLMQSLGCELVKCPANASPSSRDCFVNAAKIHAEESPNAVFLNQMNNCSNRDSHYETTAPEIWRALDGKVDGFTASAGTGGTFMGIADFLKQKTDGRAVCWFADKKGSGLCHYIKTKGQDGWKSEGTSFVEGIGKHNLTGNMHDALKVADDAITIDDTDAIVMIYKLIHEQGCEIGASGGLNLCAAKALAMTLPEGSNVVTTVADGAEKYASKLFNKSWLIENGHWDAIPEEMRKYATYDASSVSA